ncbi:hypothetical protein [Shouchella lehensis]|uniref:Uncharacterized protein n=1 Tax=Shouchella lehensis G1 TaxID=1246626 RepID=A0A060LRT3_9BACI|nr:hypothetical protein [Shouchella lehensis]AIC92725.1 hypothetical protein BleG1_0110 [Shouchella lehensis G1]
MVRGIGQPNDIALSDRFTSSFLQEDIQTDEGFHFFESQNGHYSMWYPEGFYLQGEPPAYISKDHYELLNLYEDGTDSNGIERHIQVRYSGGLTPQIIKTDLSLLLDDLAYNNKYIELTHDPNKIYYGSSHKKIDGTEVITSSPSKHEANQYFSLVVNRDDTKSVTTSYRLNCIGQTTCKINTAIEKSFFDTFITQIQFQ